ncbi:MAG: carbohydrate ABC transporter permease, partial [Anaerolineales bacterium]
PLGNEENDMSQTTIAITSNTTRSGASRFWQSAAPYLFVSPFFILFLVFFLGPTLFAFYISFQDWTGVGSWSWVGFSNYQKLFTDRIFLASVTNTLYYMVANTLILIPLPLLLAVALNSPLTRAKGILRTIYFSPYLTAPVVVSLVFLTMFDWHYGLFNQILMSLGLTEEGINWTGSMEWVKFAVVIVLVWRWTGYNMVYFLAGLQTIPQELYEAATVDGAGEFQKFWFITVPMLRPVLLFVGVVSTIGASQIFDEPTMLTGPSQMLGSPGFSSLSIAQEIFREAFMNFNFGYASAIAVLVFIVLAALSWLQFRLMRGGEI